MRYTAAVTLAGAMLCAAAGAQQMPGMQMPGDAQTPAKTPQPVPRDLAQPGASPNAQAARRSIEQSLDQQKTQRGVTPASGSDAGSLMRDAFRVQEPEAPELHTGADRPPALPDLLAAVGQRKPLSLTTLLTIAEARSPAVAEARAGAEARRGEARQAGLLPDPEVGYSAEHIRGGEYGGGEQGGYLSQRFVLGGKLGLRQNALTAEARAGDSATAEQAARVRGSVSEAFYRALVAQAQVAISQRLLRVARDAAATAHQLANVGQADAPDVLTAELEAGRAEMGLVRTQRMFLADFHRLAAEASAPELPVSPLEGDLERLPSFDSDAKLTGLLANSPELARARAEVAAAEARLKAQRRETVPDLTVKAGVWNSGERIESSGRHAGAMGFADAGITLPLWNRNQGGSAAAEADVARAQAASRRTELRLRRDAEPLTEQYAAAEFECGRYRDELLPRARRAYELYTMKYQQMAAAYPQVLVSQRMLVEVQREYLEALGRAWQASSALDNFTLTGGLEEPSSGDGGSRPGSY